MSERTSDHDGYEIRFQGHLHPRWSSWFEGLTVIDASDGTTVIRGAVLDQAGLHGVLRTLVDLGLPLVSVTRMGSGTEDTCTIAD